MRLWIANAVSLLRVALAPLLSACLITGCPYAAPIMAAVCASDVIDGRLARALRTVSKRGALIDVACDILVLLAAAVVIGLRDPRYAVVAAVMAAAFASYAVHSAVAGGFAYTRLGRHNGTACYTLIAAVVTRRCLSKIGVGMPASIEWVLLGLVTLLLAASTVENVIGTVARVRRRASASARLLRSRP